MLLGQQKFLSQKLPKMKCKLLKELFSPVIVFNEKAGAPKCL